MLLCEYLVDFGVYVVVFFFFVPFFFFFLSVGIGTFYQLKRSCFLFLITVLFIFTLFSSAHFKDFGWFTKFQVHSSAETYNFLMDGSCVCVSNMG